MSTLTIDQIVAIRKLSKNDIDFARDIAAFVLAKAEQDKSCTTCQTRIAHLENVTYLQLEVITDLENRLEAAGKVLGHIRDYSNDDESRKTSIKGLEALQSAPVSETHSQPKKDADTEHKEGAE